MSNSPSSDQVACPVVITLSNIGPITSQTSGQISRPGRPNARPRFSPRIGRQLSLNIRVSSAPHQMTIGNFEFRQMLTAVRRLCGHDLIGPRGVFDQSISRTNFPISPPPVSQPESRDVLALFDFPLIAYPSPSPSVDVINNVYTQAAIRLSAVL